MKNILLIGLGRFGRHIALQLNKLGHEVMAVDSNEERVNAIIESMARNVGLPYPHERPR